MKAEFFILIFTVLTSIICVVVYKYYEQKQLNTHLRQTFSLLYNIRVYQSFISKRDLYLDRYNFQLYNLNEALLEQDYPDFEKNTYF